MGLPTLEPELHPSYALKSCVPRPFGNLFTVTDEDFAHATHWQKQAVN